MRHGRARGAGGTRAAGRPPVASCPGGRRVLPGHARRHGRRLRPGRCPGGRGRGRPRPVIQRAVDVERLLDDGLPGQVSSLAFDLRTTCGTPARHPQSGISTWQPQPASRCPAGHGSDRTIAGSPERELFMTNPATSVARYPPPGGLERLPGGCRSALMALSVMRAAARTAAWGPLLAGRSPDLQAG
jgi:hypothetical protein